MNELSDSEKHIIKNVQKKAFYEGYSALQKGKKLSPHSKILNLCPKIDEDGIMRLDTRLQMLNLSHMMLDTIPYIVNTKTLGRETHC